MPTPSPRRPPESMRPPPVTGVGLPSDAPRSRVGRVRATARPSTQRGVDWLVAARGRAISSAHLLTDSASRPPRSSLGRRNQSPRTLRTSAPLGICPGRTTRLDRVAVALGEATVRETTRPSGPLRRAAHGIFRASPPPLGASTSRLRPLCIFRSLSAHVTVGSLRTSVLSKRGQRTRAKHLAGMRKRDKEGESSAERCQPNRPTANGTHGIAFEPERLHRCDSQTPISIRVVTLPRSYFTTQARARSVLAARECAQKTARRNKKEAGKLIKVQRNNKASSSPL